MIETDSIISSEWDGRPRRLYAVICETCSMKFYARKDSGTRCCSRKCARVRHSAAHTVPVTCWTCRTDFRKKLANIGKATHGLHFCSRKCKDKAQSIKGGCKEIRPAHYKNGAYAYRSHLKDACEGCGDARKFILIVHHKDGDRENNRDDNLETLCLNCHGLRHLKKVQGIWMLDFTVLTPRELLNEVMAVVDQVAGRLTVNQDIV